MQTIIVTTDTANHAALLINLLKKLPYIKSVVAEKTFEPLTATDWVRPGRPATEKEIDQLILEMDNDGPGEDAEIVFKRIKKGLRKHK